MVLIDFTEIIVITMGLILAGCVFMAVHSYRHREKRNTLVPIVLLGFISTFVTALYLITEWLDDAYYSNPPDIMGLFFWWAFMGIPALALWISMTIIFYSRSLRGMLQWVLAIIGLCGTVGAIAFGVFMYIHLCSPVGWPR